MFVLAFSPHRQRHWPTTQLDQNSLPSILSKRFDLCQNKNMVFRELVLRRRGSCSMVTTREEETTTDEDDNTVLKGRRKKRATKVANAEPSHWRLDTDDIVLLMSDPSPAQTVNATFVRFTVRGKPLPLQRHRSSRGFTYNPSAPAQTCFRKIVSDMLFIDEEIEPPLFAPHQSLAVSIAFRLRRPRSHFVGGRPGPGRLKPSAPKQVSSLRGDVDNLAKFVLDSLNFLLYEDDQQVQSLHVTKFLDNEDECLGATDVCIRVLEDEHLPKLLNSSFDLY